MSASHLSASLMDATAQELIARLRRNPDDPEAFASLRAHYQRIGDYASLANLLEGWAGRASDRGAGAHAMYEAGELVLGALADRERAVRMYERALTLDARHQDAFLRLRGLFEDAGEMRRLADMLEKQAGALSKAGADPRDVALLYHQLGEIWEHRFSRVDKAVNHYRRAFELDPSFVAALYAAREIYRAAGNMKAAATLLEKEAKAELDGARRNALWRELAHLRAEHLDDQEGAARALKRALADAPGDLEVMSDLARVYLTRAERTDDDHVRASDRHRAADLLYQMAQQVPTDHALAYLEQALDARPDHDGAMLLYERMAGEIGQPARLPPRWVAYLAHAPDRPESATRRKQLAQAYLDAGQVDYAITCLEWLLDAGDAEAAEQLVTLYRQVGRHDDVVRALGVAAQGLPPDKRVPRLRELVAALRDRGELERAGELGAQILDIEPGDPEALHLLEESCRKTGDWTPLRNALLSASRVSGLSATERTQRLKQVASLSEKHLDDVDGAISAWRGVSALDPSDVEARSHLKRLLRSAERWDQLVELLEREALTVTEVEPKAELYRQVAEVQRDHMGDLEAAIEAYRNLRDLLPGDVDARDALSDALVEAGAYLEAIPLLRRRIDQTGGDERARLLRLLANVLEEHVGDEEGAFETWARLLDENPADLEAIAHMVAIDEQAGRHERLLSTLSYKAEVLERDEKSAVLVRMASIADEALNDLDRSAELYGRALELSPRSVGILDALCAVYDRAERFRDLVVLLRETAQREDDASRRGELYRRIARTLAHPVGNDDGAAEAWREVLAAGEDEEALRFLRRHATRKDDPEALADALARLEPLIADTEERKELLLERADVLAERLDRDRDAIVCLRRVVEELAPDHLGALQQLSQLCEARADLTGLADALWRQLDVVEDPGLRVPVARRLSDLHEKEAPEVARAVDALYAWAQADPADSAPLERLAPLLESASRWQDLVGVLDALAGRQDDEGAASQLVRRSAEIAYRQLGDVDGAWSRLAPRVADGDDEAETDLRALAKGAGRAEQLAELYVGFAKERPELDVQKRRWMDAARVYEEQLDATSDALEAVLRAFAVDLDDTEVLDEADRVAELGQLWERLGQVYETLIRRAESTPQKVELLLRHAQLLDTRSGDPSAALDQTLRACSLAPEDDAVLALAEERAPRAGRAEELLITYDKRKSAAEDDAGRVEALLRAARLCETDLGDRQRAVHYMAQAIALTVRSPETHASVEQLARELDEASAEGGLRRSLVEILAALAEDMEEDPVGGARLLLRASRLLREELDSATDGFAVLKRAASFAPGEDEVLDALTQEAHAQGKLGELDFHLAHLVEEALDSATAAGLLRRRGELLEESFGRHEDAAEVWSRLSTVTSGDPDARARLRSALRRAGKHQDLLVALQRDVRSAESPDDELTLRKEVARVWDEDLQNRWEALEAWQKVARAAPDDAEAAAAIARLEESGRRDEEISDLAIVAPPPHSTDESLAPPSEEAPANEFSDLTDQEAVDSSQTMLDDGLREELSRALLTSETVDTTPPPSEVETAQVKLPSAPSQPREMAAAEVAPTESTPPELPSAVEVAPPGPDPLSPRETKKLSPADLRRPSEAPPAEGLDEAMDFVSTPMPGMPEADFEDDYTAVADDVFDQLRDDSPAGFEPEIESLGTGEIELLEEAEPAEVASFEALSDVVELEDDLEEIEELEEIEDIEALDDISGLVELDDEEAAPPRTDRE